MKCCRLLLHAAVWTGLQSACAAPVPKTTVQEEMKQLEGEWIIESFQIDGKEDKDPRSKDAVWAFKGDKIKMRARGEPAEEKWLPYTLDMTKDLKQMDLQAPEQKVLAIYKLDGDRLTICFGSPFVTKERPTKFESDPDGKYWLMVLARKNKR